MKTSDLLIDKDVLTLVTEPNSNQLGQIEKWLRAENNEKDEGFFRNWDTITGAFNNNQLWVTTLNDFPIGFVVIYISDSSLTAVIDIAEVKPSERKRGVGRRMVDETLNTFRTQGVLAVRLECRPISSESFWKKMGFRHYPDKFPKSPFELYKPLIETLSPSKTKRSKSTIGLWNCELYSAKRQKAEWIWELDLLEDQITLRQPIIFPVLSDWKVQLCRNNHELFSEKVKRFPSNEGIFDGFLIVRQLIL